MPDTETLTRHTLSLVLDGDLREESYEGRPHLVAPVTAVREMVLGGDGGELLPAEEIQASADLWNGTLITIGHPPTNANQRPVADAHGVGRLFDVTANGELRGEAWIDLTRVQDVEGAEAAVDKLRKGAEKDELSLEVSTAYLAAFDPTPGVHNGTRYSGVQRGLVPEHLALLPDATGKCSIADGCGAPRKNVLATAREPDFSGTSSGEWSAPTLKDYVSALGFEDVEAVADLTEDQAREIASHTLLGDPAATSFGDLSFFPVVEPMSGDLNENALRAVISGRGAQADIASDTLASAQGIARTLLADEFDADLEENVDHRTLLRRGLDAIREAFDGLAGRENQEVPAESRRDLLEDAVSEQFGGEDRFTWVRATFDDRVVFAIEDPGDEVGLFELGYEFDDETGTVMLADDPVEVRETVSFETVENTEEEEETMDREQIIDRLENADAFDFSREELEDFDQSRLVALNEALPEDGPDAEEEDEPGAEGVKGPDEGVEDGAHQNADLTPEDAAYIRELREAGAEPEAVARAVQRMNAEAASEAEEREDLIERLENTQDCDLAREEIEGLRTETLQRLAKPGPRRNFLGRGGARSRRANDASYFDEHPTTPAIVTRESA